jgi:hypothetical protein
MRRDVFIENDSGGLSVIAAGAADEIIEDGRENDLQFVERHQALLLKLYGDDSLPVRIVVDEPLMADLKDRQREGRLGMVAADSRVWRRLSA